MIQIVKDMLHQFGIVRARQTGQQTASLVGAQVVVGQPVERSLFKKIDVVCGRGVGSGPVGLARDDGRIESGGEVRFGVEFFSLV